MMDTGPRWAVAPMGSDCNLGAIRAVYPIEDAICLLHGGVGCSFNARFLFTIHDNRFIRLLSTGIENKHVIFGGEELLEEGLEKAIETSRPELVVVLGTCIPALTGDDLEGVARRVAQRRGVRVIALNNPNYKGGQLLGYHSVVSAYVEQLMEPPGQVEKRSVNLLGVMPGEHNWVNDEREMRRLLEALGLEVRCTLVGAETRVKDILRAPGAEANVLAYPSVGLPAARQMREKFDTPWIETTYPPVGIEASREWLRKIAGFFGLEKRAEEVIAEEMRRMGRALRRLQEGQVYNLQFFSGKTYAIAAAPFQLPAMVRFLYEDLDMHPYVVAFQEMDEPSYGQLMELLNNYGLSPQVQTHGDHREFKEAIARDYRYPGGDPWLVFGSWLDAFDLAIRGVRVPVIRFSYPVMDYSILTEVPFMGLRGVITWAERIHNSLNAVAMWTHSAFGHFPNPYEFIEEQIRAAGSF